MNFFQRIVATLASRFRNLTPDQVQKPVAGQNIVYIHNRLRERTRPREVVTIEKWKLALDNAERKERPDRRMLYDLYRMAMTDAHLRAVVSTRRHKITEQPFKIVDASGVENYELTDRLDSVWFREFLTHAQDSIFWGHSLIQLIFDNDVRQVSVALIPRKHVKPELGEIVENEWDHRGWAYRGWVNLIEVGDPDDLGLLSSATLNYIYKKDSVIGWSNYGELFGLPHLIGRTTGLEEKNLDEFERILQDFGENRYMLLTQGEQVEALEPGKTDVVNIWKELAKYADDLNSKLFLGQTMTTDGGQSYAQAIVHERVSETYLASDKTLLKAVVNEKLLPILPGFEGYRMEWLRHESMSMLDRAELYKKIKELGFGFDFKTVERDFGVELSENTQEN